MQRGTEAPNDDIEKILSVLAYIHEKLPYITAEEVSCVMDAWVRLTIASKNITI